MMTHDTLDQLRTLKLFGMADALTEQLTLPAATAMDFEARVTLLVDREVYARDERRRMRLLRRARLKYPQAVSRIWIPAQDGGWTGLASLAWWSATGSPPATASS